MFHVLLLTGKGYQGHMYCVVPHKRRKGCLLTFQQTVFNRKLSKGRVIVENAISRLKVWKALKREWRHRIHLHHVVFNVIVHLTNITLRARPVRKAPHPILYDNLY